MAPSTPEKRKLNSERVNQILEAYKHPSNTLSLYKISKSFRAPYSTLRDRLHGTPPCPIVHTQRQILTPVQEGILEAYIVFPIVGDTCHKIGFNRIFRVINPLILIINLLKPILYHVSLTFGITNCCMSIQLNF